jgi:hypothetical protein
VFYVGHLWALTAASPRLPHSSISGLIIGVSIVVGFVLGVLTATSGIDDMSYPGSLGEGANPHVGGYQLRSIAERQHLYQHQEL